PRRLSRRAPTPASPPASPCPEASAARRYPGNASRHVVGRTVTLVDTEGFVHELYVHPASVQDRDGAQLLLRGKSRRDFPCPHKLWRDSGNEGRRKCWLEENSGWDVEVVRLRNEGRQRWYGLLPRIERPPLPRGFIVVVRRWGAERTFGWINLSRRLSKDYEQKPFPARPPSSWP
ncbi:transposase, partial [Corallococcus sp. AB045]|uniref:transposase n=1 Tax=Corallococcus sp. AB045 TaxID=2316719 RepID=UPI0035175E22